VFARKNLVQTLEPLRSEAGQVNGFHDVFLP